MADYVLKNDETVKAEPANDVKVRVFADDGKEVIMRKEEFDALFVEDKPQTKARKG